MRARAVSSGLGRVFLHPTPARRADGQLRPVLVPNLECAAFDHLVPVPVAKLVERLRLVSIDLESHSGDSTRLAALGALAKRHRPVEEGQRGRHRSSTCEFWQAEMRWRRDLNPIHGAGQMAENGSISGNTSE